MIFKLHEFSCSKCDASYIRESIKIVNCPNCGELMKLDRELDSSDPSMARAIWIMMSQGMYWNE